MELDQDYEALTIRGDYTGRKELPGRIEVAGFAVASLRKLESAIQAGNGPLIGTNTWGEKFRLRERSQTWIKRKGAKDSDFTSKNYGPW